MKKLPEKMQNDLTMFIFGRFKIPLVGYIKPEVIELSDEKTIIKIPFARRNKNHIHSMYFGVLASAADIAGGLAAMKQIENTGKNIHLSFKDFHADFLKRAEGDTYFENTQGKEMREFIDKVISSGERMNLPMKIVATVPSQFKNEPVAVFTLTLSLKLKG